MYTMYALFTIKRIVAIRTFTLTKLIMCIARSGQIAISLVKIELFKQPQARKIPQAYKTPQAKKERKQASKVAKSISGTWELRGIQTSRNQKMSPVHCMFPYTTYLPEAWEETCCVILTNYCENVLTYAFMLRQLLRIRWKTNRESSEDGAYLGSTLLPFVFFNPRKLFPNWLCASFSTKLRGVSFEWTTGSDSCGWKTKRWSLELRSVNRGFHRQGLEIGDSSFNFVAKKANKLWIFVLW